jgi:iron-sulfur cluster repair protein YtfE (RIC family)
MPDSIPIDVSCIVDDFIARYPETSRVFHHFGIDYRLCAQLTIADASADEATDMEAVLDSLRCAVRYNLAATIARC